MKTAALSLFILTGALLSAVEIRSGGSPVSSFQDDPEGRFLNRTKQLLETVRREDSAFRERLGEAEQEKLLEGLLKQLLPEAVPVAELPRKKAAEKRTPPPELRYEKARGFLTLRLYSSRELPEGFAAVLSGKEGPVRGVILDLRECSAGFMGPEAEPVVRTIRKAPFPVAVLVSEKTCGGAEVMAYLLRSSRKCAVLGEPTAGFPFPLRKTAILGKEYALPVKTASFTGIPAKPLVPSAATTKQHSGPADPLLRQAGDLLTAWNALNHRN